MFWMYCTVCTVLGISDITYVSKVINVQSMLNYCKVHNIGMSAEGTSYLHFMEEMKMPNTEKSGKFKGQPQRSKIHSQPRVGDSQLSKDDCF